MQSPRFARAEHCSSWAIVSMLMVCSFTFQSIAAERRTPPSQRADDAPSVQQPTKPPDEQTKAAARQMAREALDLMHQERWSEAQSLLARAYRLVPAPTVALLEGRALERMSRLADAARRYEVAANTPVGNDSPEAFRQAVRDAQDELSDLHDRVPKLAITVQGETAPGQRVEVSLDGEVLALNALDTPRDVNPGEHIVKAIVDGDVVVEDHVLVKEGESKPVLLRLEHRRPPPSRDVAVPNPDTTSANNGSAMRTWGWVTLGVGVAGVATGVVAGKLMVDTQDTLDKGCTPTCPPSLEDDLSRFRTYRTVSTVGYGVGAVGIAVGALLLLLAPSNTEPAHSTTAIWSDGRMLGVTGKF